MSDVATKPDEKTVAAATSLNMLTVKVYSPYQVYFDKNARSVTAVNRTGPFDILPRHHNFLTILLPCELQIQSDEGMQRIRISRGVMHVKANKVTIFLDV